MRTTLLWASCCALAGVLGVGGCTITNPEFCGPGDPGCSATDDLAGQPPGDDDGPAMPADLGHASPDLLVTCGDNGDCPSGICRPDGTCAGADEVIYVDNANGTCHGSHLGSQGDPFCLAREGVQAAHTSGRKLMHVAGSSAGYDSMTISGITLSIYGPGGYAVPAARIEGAPDAGATVPAISVGAGANVLLDGLEVANGVADLVSCTSTVAGTTPVLRVHRGRVHLGGGNGVFAGRCKVTVDRTVVALNKKAGIEVGDGGDLQVVNSIVAANTQMGIRASVGKARVVFSTVVQNGNAGTGAMDCGKAGAVDRVIEASLVVYNSRYIASSQLSDGCQMNNSAMDENYWKTGKNNQLPAYPDFVGNTLYHLSPTTSTTKCCIDKLNAGMAGGVVVDYEGTQRPQGPAWDIGANELIK